MAEFLETAAGIAREAGALIAGYHARGIGFELKGDYDLVTEADRASERLIVEKLRNHFPTHSVVAEEGGGQEGSSEYRWYVDPLDGTTNFAHGFPMFNVTLALEKAGELIAGVIYHHRGKGWRRLSEQPPHSCVEGGSGGGCAGGDRLSFAQEARECQRAFLLSTGDDVAWSAAGRRGGAGSGVCSLRSLGRVLGVRPESMGYGGGRADGPRSRGHGQRYARRPIQFEGSAHAGG